MKKIRAFVARTVNGINPLHAYLTTVEPPGVECSYCYGPIASLVLVQAEESFDWSQFRLLAGVTQLPSVALSTPYASISTHDKRAFADIYQDVFGMPLDDTRIVDAEDLYCAFSRANGEATPVSGTVRGSVFRGREQHGLYDGDRIVFAIGPPELSIGSEYHIVSAVRSEFMVSELRGGSPVLVSDGEYTAVRRWHRFRHSPAGRTRAFTDAFE